MTIKLKRRPKPVDKTGVVRRPDYLGVANPDILFVIDPLVGREDADDAPKSPVPISARDYDFWKEHCRKFNIPMKHCAIIRSAPPVTAELNASQKQLSDHLKIHREEFSANVSRAKPKLIVAMGKSGASQVFNRSVKITQARGTPVDNEEFGCIVLPSLGIGHVIRIPENQRVFDADFSTLEKVVNNGFTKNYQLKAETEYNWTTDLTPFLLKADAGRLDLSVDTETLGTRYYDPASYILTVQLCAATGKAVAVPIDYDHTYKAQRDPKRFYTRAASLASRKRIVAQLKRLLEHPNVYCFGQNFKFDYLFLKHKLGITVKHYEDDTICLMHGVDENMQRKDLDEIVRQYVPEMAGYADAFSRDPVHFGKSRMDLVPPDKMLLYGTGDADATWRAKGELETILKADPKNYKCYRRVVMPGLNAFAQIEDHGFVINKKALKAFEKMLRAHQTKEYKRLKRMVPPSIRIPQLDKFEKRDRTIERKIEKGELPVTARKVLAKASITRPGFLRAMLFTHEDGLQLVPRVFTKSTAKKKNHEERVPSTSGKMHLAYFEHDHPFITGIMEFIKNEKLLGTYVGTEDVEDGGSIKGFYKYLFDGRIRPTYLLHRTVTGRTACVHSDTVIETRDRGPVQIKNIRVGDYVWTHKKRWRKVTRTYIKPAELMYNVSLSNGQSLLCTAGHGILTPHGWKALSDVVFESYSKQFSNGCRSVSAISDDNTNNGTDRPKTTDRPKQHPRDNETQHTERRDKQTQGGTVSREQTWNSQSYAGAEAGEFHRRMRGWLRLLNNSRGWQARVCASRCVRGNDGHFDSNVAGVDGHSSHRRGQAKQLAGQFGVDDQVSSCEDTPCSIVSVNPTHVYDVYDIEVEEDSSYLAAGISNHNSSDPNGQNFPKRGKLAKKYREIFTSPEGYVLLEVDFSQLELRIAAIMANDATMMRLYKEGKDIHTATACAVMGITLEEFNQLPKQEQALKRFQAKAVNFGFLYGMGWRKFMNYARTEYNVTFNEQEAQFIRNTFFSLYRNLRLWHNSVRDYVRVNGYVRTFDGRVRHLPSVFSPDEGIASSAERQAINSPVQAFGSDLGLMALTLLVKNVSFDKVRPIGFIHDAIVCLAREAVAKEAARTIKYWMEHIPLKKWFDFESPIPIIAEASVGKNLSSMIEIPDSWYDDDDVTSWYDIQIKDWQANCKRAAERGEPKPPKPQRTVSRPRRVRTIKPLVRRRPSAITSSPKFKPRPAPKRRVG